MFGAATLVGQLTTSADTAMATSMTAMHTPVGNGTLAASAQEPGFDEMVKVCNEHMASMSSMMQMMQGMPGMSGGMR